MRYAVVIEKAKRNYSAYILDVPGCMATGKTVQQTLSNLREALVLHFEGMREDGDKIPDPETLVDYVDVDIASPRSAPAIPASSRRKTKRAASALNASAQTSRSIMDLQDEIRVTTDKRAKERIRRELRRRGHIAGYIDITTAGERD